MSTRVSPEQAKSQSHCCPEIYQGLSLLDNIYIPVNSVHEILQVLYKPMMTVKERYISKFAGKTDYVQWVRALKNQRLRTQLTIFLDFFCKNIKIFPAQ